MYLPTSFIKQPIDIVFYAYNINMYIVNYYL